MQDNDAMPLNRQNAEAVRHDHVIIEAFNLLRRFCDTHGLAFVGAIAAVDAVEGQHVCRLQGHAPVHTAETAALLLDSLERLERMRCDLLRRMD